MTCVIIPEVVYTIPGGLTYMLLESRVGGRVAENVFEDMMAQFFFFPRLSGYKNSFNLSPTFKCQTQRVTLFPDVAFNRSCLQ